jgi:hypothetical protein
VVDDEEGVVTEEERVPALVHILLSASARLDERDDAAMDWGSQAARRLSRRCRRSHETLK